MSTNVPTTPRPSGMLALPDAPDFMEADQQMGTDVIRTKMRPPFLKILQRMSERTTLDQFGGEGAAILVPDMMPVIDRPGGGPVRIVPVFMYLEWLKLSSIKLKGVEPMIADRSTNPNSELAKLAGDRRTWMVDHVNYPGNPDYRYRIAEALTFLCFFQEEHLQLGIPFVLSFMKGSYGTGQKFCNNISMRRRPPFGCVFDLTVDQVPGRNAQGEWWRFLITNPSQEPWVSSKEEYEVYKKAHTELMEAHGAGDIEAEYDEEELHQAAGGAETDSGAGSAPGVAGKY